jgi:uncharacterized protein (DUF1330 family)
MDEPIFMLNALWFKKQGGKEKYLEYAAAVAPLLETVGGEAGSNYGPEAALIGNWDPDVFFVVRYPSQAAFESMVRSSAYAEIRHLREDALENSLLIRCKSFDWS